MVVGPQLETEAFWRDEFEPSEDDIDEITGIILESAKPQSLEDLAAEIIAQRAEAERDALAEQTQGTKVYRPQDEHESGDELTFSEFDYAIGRVEGVRAGYNPRYGDFAVIEVAFQDEQLGVREFASKFDHTHRLNRPVEELIGLSEEVGIDVLVAQMCDYVVEKLAAALQGQDDFVQFDEKWFLAELLPEFHVGHGNLAEAVIDQAGRPMAPREIVKELGMDTTASLGAQVFALNRGLAEDERFDNLGTVEEPLWYLRALEPKGLAERPAVLRPAFVPDGEEYLGVTMLDLVEAIGDELDSLKEGHLRQEGDIRFEVIFPHLYAGTMPATKDLVAQLSDPSRSRLPVTLIDARGGGEIEGWALPQEGYICGLADWYASVHMVVGGIVRVRVGDAADTFELLIEEAQTRGRRFVNTVGISNERIELSSEYAAPQVETDEHMLLQIQNRDAVARFMARTEEAEVPLEELVRRAFLELAKLSGRGTAHAKAIYSAVNLQRRSGAVPVFAELTRRACYDPVGDGFWAYDSSLEQSVYETPDDMRERPLSEREDVLVDQVVRYLGQ